MAGALRRGVASIVALAMAALVLDVLWGVFSRFVLGSAAQWTDELAQLLMVWVAMFGAALAYAERQHLGVDLLPMKLQGASRAWTAAFSDLVVLVFAGVVMVYGGAWLVAQRFDSGQVLPALDISRGWVYLAIPTGGVLILLRATVGIIVSVREAIAGRDHPPHPANG